MEKFPAAGQSDGRGFSRLDRKNALLHTGLKFSDSFYPISSLQALGSRTTLGTIIVDGPNSFTEMAHALTLIIGMVKVFLFFLIHTL
jgi:hypothetical protein